MEITIRYFASAREMQGRSRETREVIADTSVIDVLKQLSKDNPQFARLLDIARPMVNQEYVHPGYILKDGDELAIIPPVSGGVAVWSDRFEIAETAIDLAEIESQIATESAGAIVTFVGAVRNNARGRKVVRLYYEAYEEAAEKMLRGIGQEIHEKWDIERLVIVHRNGVLLPGDASVVIAVSSAHRAAAFEASRHAIERIKEIVPIWKLEHYEDGSIWVGSEAEYQSELRAEPAS